MKKARIKSTEQEKLIREAKEAGDYIAFNMKENDINTILEKEQGRKFNAEVEKYNEMLEKKNDAYKEAREEVDYDINQAEIKPMFSRLLVKPFKQNPFQKLEIKNGLIIDTGGYTPNIDKNPVTGKYEEEKEFIVTGIVVEVGPETKYVREGDVVYYRIDTAVPVPFFKQGFVSVAESQIISVVNTGLEKRFCSILNGD